jgi:hypothetical protein
MSAGVVLPVAAGVGVERQLVVRGELRRQPEAPVVGVECLHRLLEIGDTICVAPLRLLVAALGIVDADEQVGRRLRRADVGNLVVGEHRIGGSGRDQSEQQAGDDEEAAHDARR